MLPRSPPEPLTQSTSTSTPLSGSRCITLADVFPPPKLVMRRSEPRRFERYSSRSGSLRDRAFPASQRLARRLGMDVLPGGVLLRLECPVDLGGLLIVDHHHGPDAPARDDRPGAVFSHFQPVEGIDRAAPGGDDAVVLHHRHGRVLGEGGGCRLGLDEDGAEGQPRHVPEHDVTLWDEPRLEVFSGHGEGHDARRAGDDDRVYVGVPEIDVLVQQHRPARHLARLATALLDAYKIAGLQVSPVRPLRGDEERLLVQASREGPLGAREELLVAGSVDEIANLASGLTLAASVAAGAKLAHFGAALAPPELDPLRGQTLRGADPRRLDLQAGAEVEGLERHEGLREVHGASHRAMVLQHDRVAPPSEDPG